MVTKTQYEKWCENATYTQSEIDHINELRMEYAVQANVCFTPYIPLHVYGHGPVVKPEVLND